MEERSEVPFSILKTEIERKRENEAQRPCKEPPGRALKGGTRQRPVGWGGGKGCV